MPCVDIGGRKILRPSIAYQVLNPDERRRREQRHGRGSRSPPAGGSR